MDPSSADFEALLQRGYRYALSLTHDPESAGDVLQDACLSISQRGEGWNEGYLLKTIRNRYIDTYRREQAVPMHALDESTAVSTDWMHSFDQLDAGYDDAMVEALQHLRDDERELLFLSVIAGYSTNRLIDITEKPRGTVLSIIHRAKKKLHRWLTAKDERDLS